MYFLEEFPVAWKEFENLFERNRIFMDRTINVGSISAEQAISMVLQDLTLVQQLTLIYNACIGA
jgi:NADH:ubiquinone oxidoreductase subunit D